MKTVDSIEKGILRRAFAHMLPEDVLYRKKSAYPSVQKPGLRRSDSSLGLANSEQFRRGNPAATQ